MRVANTPCKDFQRSEVRPLSVSQQTRPEGDGVRVTDFCQLFLGHAFAAKNHKGRIRVRRWCLRNTVDEDEKEGRGTGLAYAEVDDPLPAICVHYLCSFCRVDDISTFLTFIKDAEA